MTWFMSHLFQRDVSGNEMEELLLRHGMHKELAGVVFGGRDMPCELFAMGWVILELGGETIVIVGNFAKVFLSVIDFLMWMLQDKDAGIFGVGSACCLHGVSVSSVVEMETGFHVSTFVDLWAGQRELGVTWNQFQENTAPRVGEDLRGLDVFRMMLFIRMKDMIANNQLENGVELSNTLWAFRGGVGELSLKCLGANLAWILNQPKFMRDKVSYPSVNFLGMCLKGKLVGW